MNGNSDEISRAYLDHLTIGYRYLETQEATTACTVFGRELNTPIMLGGLAHYEKLHEGGAPAYAQAAKDAGTAMWTGFMEDAEFEQVLAVGAPAARIFKPFEKKELIFKALEHDEAYHACAFAIDVDHAYNKKGRRDTFFEETLKSPTKQDLRDFASHSKVPFFVKGVLSVRDAVICAEAGVAGIVVSQHQNMFPWCPPTVKLLPEIRKAVGSSLTILCDSCLDDGYAAFKALALGADAVFTVRPMIPLFRENGAEAVRERLERMTDELRSCLSRTGSKDIRSIDPTVIQYV